MKRYKEANEGIHAPEKVKERAIHPAGTKRTHSRWTGAAAAALAVALIGGAALYPWGSTGNPEDNTGGPTLLSEDSGGAPAGRSMDNDGAVSAAEYGTVSRPYAVSLASYPEMAQYPSEADYFSDLGDDDKAWEKANNAYSEAWSAWWEGRRGLRSETDYTGTLDQFLTASTAQFLTGAGEDNRVYSPLNVYMALSMLAESTDGNSRQQLLGLLQADSIETVRARAADLWRDNYSDDGSLTSILANSLWLRSDMSYNTETLETLAREYFASAFAGEMGSEGYNAALQDWLSEQTRGLLSEQASGVKMNPETVLALASTIYYKAAWDSSFNENLTKPDTFHAPSGDVDTDFMHSSHTGAYYWGEHFSAVQLSFQNAGSMWLILPDEGYSVDQLLDSGEAMDFLLADKSGRHDEATGEYVENWPDQKYLTINLSMPRFDVSSDLDLIEGLKTLGVTDIFDTNVSNFDPLGAEDPLYVSQAKHAARVKVDEDGCEAAAYTIMIMDTGAAMPPDEEVDFTLDRPFFFAVTNGGAGMPLFTGVVNQP